MTSMQGDPTDTSIKLRPLEPATGQALARDLVLKTRRRKGLGDQIAVSKYLDDEFVVSDSAHGWGNDRVDVGTIAGAVCVWPRRLTRVGVGIDNCIRGKTVNKPTYIKSPFSTF